MDEPHADPSDPVPVEVYTVIPNPDEPGWIVLRNGEEFRFFYGEREAAVRFCTDDEWRASVLSKEVKAWRK